MKNNTKILNNQLKMRFNGKKNQNKYCKINKIIIGLH